MAHDPQTQNVPYAIWSNYSPPPSGAAIYSISGNLTDGSVITIKGEGFGQGASNFRYENFSGFNSAGQLLSDVNNSFDEVSPYAKSEADSRSGTYALQGYGFTGTDYRGLTNKILMPENPTESFTSYSVKNPIGKKMPHQDPATPVNTYSVDSDCKLVWIGSVYGIVNDLVLPTIVGSQMKIAGNDISSFDDLGGNNPSFWTFGDWVRFTTWLKADKDNPSIGGGSYYFQALNPTNGITERTVPSANPDAIIFRDGTAPYNFKEIGFPGWMRTRTLAENPTADQTSMLYDDIYQAWGDNAAARVEIGNNANYGLCTKLSVCDPLKDSNGNTVWSDGQMTLNLRQSDLDFNSDVFLFVTGADNTQLVARQIL